MLLLSWSHPNYQFNNILFPAKYCEMEGAQHVDLNVDDDEANQKNAIRICHQCYEILSMYV